MNKEEYYKHFLEDCKINLEIQDEEKIGELWKLLCWGQEAQEEINERADVEAITIEDYVEIINNNPNLLDFVEKACEYRADALSVMGKKLALWSGGGDVGELASQLGFGVLAETPLGSLANNMPPVDEWKTGNNEALWNILSKKLVENYEGNEIHIYFRNVDDFSVLFLTEIPAIKENRNIKQVVWHPLVNNPTRDMKEIGYFKADQKFQAVDCQAAAEKGVIRCKPEEADRYILPIRALESGIKGASPIANEKVFKKYRSRKFKASSAPFYREDEQTEGFDVKDKINKYWNGEK